MVSSQVATTGGFVLSTALERLRAALADRYRIERELGRGGMATVYLAEDLKHRRPVAIKVIDPDLSADIGPDRFLREIEIAAQLNHPHILPLHDSGSADGQLYYVMPYVEGESLRARLDRVGQLPVEDALRLAREIASALGHAHERGIVHRDIKPENVLLSGGMALVADFGIARVTGVSALQGKTHMATQAGMSLGTPLYMSPEQATGGLVDARTDLYALACVLYEMLAGRPPFVAPTTEGVIRQHLTVEAHPVTELRPAVSRGVAAAIARGLAKLSADRYATAAGFAAALAHSESEALSASPTRSGQERRAIAVLPFLNLSADGPHAYFAGGLHDELLTQLAKVAALKVISRTSVMGYQGTSKRLKEIAGELGVGSVVEGSVQVLGERLRVNVQLIDAATDEHLWAERYDRTLDDAFAIQSEVAQQVVAAVGAVLTSDEQGRIAAPPTANAEAYRVYLQAREFWMRPGYVPQNWEAAQQLYERAVKLDPGFALAHAELSQVHGAMYFFRSDPSAARATRQRQAAETALLLAPDLPQAHAAMGLAHYWGRRDYRRGLDEFAIALEGLPNDVDLWLWRGGIHRRLGNWNDVLAAFEKATQLNPRNADSFFDLGGNTYRYMRRYADAVEAYDRALSLAPDHLDAAISRGWTYVRWQGRFDILKEVLSRVPRQADQASGGGVAVDRANVLLWERNAEGLLQLLEAERVDVFEWQDIYLPGALYAAWAYQLRGDHEAAQAEFEKARLRLNSALSELPDDWRVHAARGMALAGLGHRDEALNEASWLQQSAVYREDALDGPKLADARARILMQAGEAEAALDELDRLLAKPSNLSGHALRLDPRWDPIRERPRFKALLTKYPSGSAR
jgi:eukaryotic-like serine/threonine-protein kinase